MRIDIQTSRSKTSDGLRAPQRGATAHAVAAGSKLNPYLLLSLTLLLPAVIVATSAAMQLPLAGIIATLLAYFGLLFLTARKLNQGGLTQSRNH